MVAVCLSFFQKRETSVTSTKHQQNASQKSMAIFSICPRWGKIRNCWSLWRSTPWRKQKLVPKLCMRTISLPCVAWKCLIGDSAGVLVEGEEKNDCLFEFVYWVCWCVCLLFIYWRFNFLNCFIPTLGTHPSRVQWTCLPYLVSHRLHAIIVTMPKFSRFSVNQPLRKHKTAGFFWSIKYKKQRSNVPRIVFPCFFPRFHLHLDPKSSHQRSETKSCFVHFPPEKTVAKHWLSSILEVAKWRPWSTWRRRGSFQPVLRIWRILEIFRVEAKGWWLINVGLGLFYYSFWPLSFLQLSGYHLDIMHYSYSLWTRISWNGIGILILVWLSKPDKRFSSFQQVMISKRGDSSAFMGDSRSRCYFAAEVSRKIPRYLSGSWSLPSSLRWWELPHFMR